MAIGVGSNSGDSRKAIADALTRLAEFVSDLRVSSFYRTAPVGGPPQPDYLNAAIVGTTRLSARELLARLHSLEIASGRRPSRIRNAPRSLDLDLLLFGRSIISSPELEVPHPRLSERRFVLEPLSELIPGRVVPGLGRTIDTLLSLLKSTPGPEVIRLEPVEGLEAFKRRRARSRSGR